MKAHLFKTRQGWELYITDRADLVGAQVHSVWPSKPAAAAKAAALGATPWNY